MAQAISYAFYSIFNHFHLWCPDETTGTKPHLKIDTMNYLQAVQEITELVPDFENELNNTKNTNSYSVIRTFTERIKNMIRQNDSNLLFRSLQKMDKIYKDGDLTLKNAIENTFIYSLDNFTAFCNKDYRKMIFSQISSDLKNSYSRQIYSHGI